MKLKIIFGFLVVITLIVGYFIYSIFQSYTLNKKDLLWQPYKAGDQLIFESNYGQIDRFEITEIDKTKSQSIFHIIPHEVIDVRVQRVLIKPPKTEDNSYSDYDYNENGIHKTFKTLLTLDAYTYYGIEGYKKSLTYSGTGTGIFMRKIEDLNVLSENKNEIKIKDTDRDLHTYEVINKKYGLVNYGNQHKNWKLKQFIRNGINIYEKTTPNNTDN